MVRRGFTSLAASTASLGFLVVFVVAGRIDFVVAGRFDDRHWLLLVFPFLALATALIGVRAGQRTRDSELGRWGALLGSIALLPAAFLSVGATMQWSLVLSNH